MLESFFIFELYDHIEWQSEFPEPAEAAPVNQPETTSGTEPSPAEIQSPGSDLILK